MKIFYGVQATGNGHISRAIELLPYLQEYGTVDVFLSGTNSSLNPELPVRYTSRGVSLHYTHTGGLDYAKMLGEFNARRIWKEAKDLPVENYDCVLVDFESVSALSCRLKKIPCIGFGHQASFQSVKVPRPSQKSIRGEWILRCYAPATDYCGLHFKAYDSFIFNPVIKDAILGAEPKNKGHITVYLPHADEFIIKHLTVLKDFPFHVFSRKAKCVSSEKNITIIPVNSNSFSESMINCHGIITGAGFETPAEALYLGKKLMCIPVKGQYEQLCNAAALKELNVAAIAEITKTFPEEVRHWLDRPASDPLQLKYTTAEIVAQVMKMAKNLN